MTRRSRWALGCAASIAFALIAVSAAAGDILVDALVAHWAFDVEEGDTIADHSGNGFDATATGGEWAEGVVSSDGALTLDGLDDRVVIADFNGMPPRDIGNLDFGSISILFQFRETGSGDIIPLFYFGEADTGTEHQSLIIEIGHGGNPRNRKLYFTIVNARFCYDSRIQLLPDTWYHFVAVVGPNGNTGYLNGEEMTARNYNLGSDASYTDFFSSVSFRELLALGYGRYGLDDDFYHGAVTISDVRIYDRAISADEVGCLAALLVD